uniref:FAST kinase domain-containing protein 4 n=1 Tax=Gadus morhua TaxID=8049 RepID=A0A8C4ZMM2_GADMO
MASRLLVRCTRFLSRPSPLATIAASNQTNPISATNLSELQWAPARVWVPERRLCDVRIVARDENVPAMPRRTQLDKLVEKAETPEDILRAWKEHRGNGNQAAIAMVKLSRMVQGTQGSIPTIDADILMDPRLQDIMDTINGQVRSVNSTLVSVLRSFWAMNLPPSTSVLSYRQLALLVDWGWERPRSSEVAIVNAALKQLELRWTEISDARTVSALISKGERMSSSLMDRLEDKVVARLSTQEIRRVCLSMASRGRRCVPLSPPPISPTPLLLDMAYVYGKLNFNHSQVFQRMAAELLPRVPELSPIDITRCAKSLGFLKWLHLPLFEAFAEHYTANSEKYVTSQVCNLLMTLARLGFQPSNGEQFYSKVHSALEDSLRGLEPFLLVDVVWSLCVLQQVKPHYCLSLARPEYRAKADAALSGLVNFTPASPTVSPLQRALRESLQGLVLGRSTALRTAVDTVYGWTLDGEVMVDSENQLVDLLMPSGLHLPGEGGEQALPAGTRRLAFLAWDFPNFGLRSKELLGRFAMMKRHLQLADLLLVEVPYYEWLELKTERQRVAYLKDKMGKAVAEDMAK